MEIVIPLHFGSDEPNRAILAGCTLLCLIAGGLGIVGLNGLLRLLGRAVF